MKSLKLVRFALGAGMMLATFVGCVDDNKDLYDPTIQRIIRWILRLLMVLTGQPPILSDSLLRPMTNITVSMITSSRFLIIIRLLQLPIRLAH